MTLNVLVVDDSAVMRAMIIKTLRLCGLPLRDIRQAANGREGLDILDRQTIDLALVDINMPVMNGDEMIDRLRSNPRTASLPILVISTEGSDTRVAMLEARGARFVHKPFSPELLGDAIRRVTGVSHGQQPTDEALLGRGPDF